MSDFPKGGDIAATRVWLDNEGFNGLLVGWKADALLGADKSDMIDEIGVEKCRRLWGLLNTARQSTPQTAGTFLDLTKLKNALLNAKLEGKFLTLPDGEKFPISSREKMTNFIPSKLLVRDFHDELRLIIAETRARRRNKRKGIGGAIFFGPSGIGKSWSSMSVLLDELKDSSKSVVYFDAVSKYAYVFGVKRNIRLEGCDYPNTKEIPELHDDRTLLIYDACRGNQTSLPAIGCEVFIFSSPNADNFKQAADISSLLRFACPNWEKEELIDLEHGYGDRQSEEEIAQLIDERGGNPRAVVANADEAFYTKFSDETKMLLDGRIKLRLSLSPMDPVWPSSLLKAIYTTNKKASSPIEAFDKYIEYNVGWDYSSERAREVVYESYEQLGTAEKAAFEEWLKCEPKGSTLHAYHFEYKVGAIASKNSSASVECKALSPNDGLTTEEKTELDMVLKTVENDLIWTFPNIKKVEISTKDSLSNEVSELAKLKDSTLLYRLPANFPLIDYFNPPNNCFSVGIGKHTIKLDPALKLCNTLLPSNKQVNFIFVTTSTNYAIVNRWQSFQKGNSVQVLGKLPVNDQKLLSRLVQFCMKFKGI